MVRIRTPKEFGSLMILQGMGRIEGTMERAVRDKEAFRMARTNDPTKMAYFSNGEYKISLTELGIDLFMWKDTQVIFE